MLRILRFYITFILLFLWYMRKYKFLLVYACIAFFASTICVAQGGPPPPPPDFDIPIEDELPINNGIIILAVMALSYGYYVVYKNKKRAA